VTRNESSTQEHFVLIKENHCQGFLEVANQTPERYSLDQELTLYNQFNDAVMQILQHNAIRNGFIPSQQNTELFILALYNLDTFRKLLIEDRLDSIVLSDIEKEHLQNDEILLNFGISFLFRLIFSQFSESVR